MNLKSWLPLFALLLLLEGCTPVSWAAPAPRLGDPDAVVLPGEGDFSSANPYSPVKGDEALKREDVEIDSLAIRVSDSFPPQYRLEVNGALPTPCHQLRAVADVPPMGNEIKVQIYSIYDPYTPCSQVMKPFNASIPLGGYVRGSYPVFVNNKEIGEITP